MPAAKFNIPIECGATYRQVVTWKDKNGANINLTGCTAKMQIRKKIGDDVALITLTTENGGIILADGYITIYMTDAQTATLVAGVYDLEIIHPLSVGQTRPDVTRVLTGQVTISKNVTR